jgi:hypothetical protein
LHIEGEFEETGKRRSAVIRAGQWAQWRQEGRSSACSGADAEQRSAIARKVAVFSWSKTS